MKRQRAVQVVVALVGLMYLSWTYPLFDSLREAGWLQKHQDPFPMFISVNITLGVFLLLAVKQPAKHRSLIAFGAWSTLAHAFTMTIMSIQAWSHGMHRKDSPQDLVIVGGIGLLLLSFLPPRESAPDRTERPHSAQSSMQPNPAGA